MLRLRRASRPLTSPVHRRERQRGRRRSRSATRSTPRMTVPATGRSPGTSTPRRGRSWPRRRAAPATRQPEPAVSVDEQPAAAPRRARPTSSWAELRPPTSYNDEDFVDTGQRGRGSTTAASTVEINWPTPVSDFDFEIYRDVNDSGAVDDADGAPLGELGPGPDARPRRPRSGRTRRPGKYFARVVNYAGGEPYDRARSPSTARQPLVPARHRELEAHLRELLAGTVLTSQDVLIGRGERKDRASQALHARRPTRRSPPAALRRADAQGLPQGPRPGAPRPQPHAPPAALQDRPQGPARLTISASKDGGALRIGYPQSRPREASKAARGLSADEGRADPATSQQALRGARGRASARSSRTLRKRASGRRRGCAIGKNIGSSRPGAEARCCSRSAAAGSATSA